MKYYYCSAIEGKRFCLIAGPFSSHDEALKILHVAKQAALQSADPKFAFAAYGTCSFECEKGEGIFNSFCLPHNAA